MTSGSCNFWTRAFAAITGYVYPLPADLLAHTRNSTHATARISFAYSPAFPRIVNSIHTEYLSSIFVTKPTTHRSLTRE